MGVNLLYLFLLIHCLKSYPTSKKSVIEKEKLGELLSKENSIFKRDANGLETDIDNPWDDVAHSPSALLREIPPCRPGDTACATKGRRRRDRLQHQMENLPTNVGHSSIKDKSGRGIELLVNRMFKELGNANQNPNISSESKQLKLYTWPKRKTYANTISNFGISNSKTNNKRKNEANNRKTDEIIKANRFTLSVGRLYDQEPSLPSMAFNHSVKLAKSALVPNKNNSTKHYSLIKRKIHAKQGSKANYKNRLTNIRHKLIARDKSNHSIGDRINKRNKAKLIARRPNDQKLFEPKLIFRHSTNFNKSANKLVKIGHINSRPWTRHKIQALKLIKNDSRSHETNIKRKLITSDKPRVSHGINEANTKDRKTNIRRKLISRDKSNHSIGDRINKRNKVKLIARRPNDQKLLQPKLIFKGSTNFNNSANKLVKNEHINSRPLTRHKIQAFKPIKNYSRSRKTNIKRKLTASDKPGVSHGINKANTKDRVTNNRHKLIAKDKASHNMESRINKGNKAKLIARRPNDQNLLAPELIFKHSTNINKIANKLVKNGHINSRPLTRHKIQALKLIKTHSRSRKTNIKSKLITRDKPRVSHENNEAKKYSKTYPLVRKKIQSYKANSPNNKISIRHKLIAKDMARLSHSESYENSKSNKIAFRAKEPIDRNILTKSTMFNTLNKNKQSESYTHISALDIRNNSTSHKLIANYKLPESHTKKHNNFYNDTFIKNSSNENLSKYKTNAIHYRPKRSNASTAAPITEGFQPIDGYKNFQALLGAGDEEEEEEDDEEDDVEDDDLLDEDII